jgi:hypothetical protein
VRALILVGGLVLIGLGSFGAVYTVVLLDAAIQRRRERRRRIEDYQDKASLDALKRTTDRINRSIDEQNQP